MIHAVSRGPTPVRVHVEADIRLAEAGLTRAAMRAGLRVVPADLPASFTLKAVTVPPSEPGLDVFVGDEHIAVVVHGVPSPAEWNAILPLVRGFLATEADDPPSPENR